MVELLKRAINSILFPFGYRFGKTYGIRIQNDREAFEIIKLVVPKYTFTGADRIYALIEAVRYVARNGLEGDFVECGVWRGGSSMAMAKSALNCNISPTIWLFDTFEGMTESTDADVDLHGFSGKHLEKEHAPGEWMKAAIGDVRLNLGLTGYDPHKLKFIKGPVEQTIPSTIPDSISILRLDTDWYESTKHELEHLYDHLQTKGVLIVDDYDDFAGSKKATDEFFAERGIHPYLVPVAGHRIYVKQ